MIRILYHCVIDWFNRTDFHAERLSVATFCRVLEAHRASRSDFDFNFVFDDPIENEMSVLVVLSNGSDACNRVFECIKCCRWLLQQMWAGERAKVTERGSAEETLLYAFYINPMGSFSLSLIIIRDRAQASPRRTSNTRPLYLCTARMPLFGQRRYYACTRQPFEVPESEWDKKVHEQIDRRRHCMEALHSKNGH